MFDLNNLAGWTNSTRDIQTLRHWHKLIADRITLLEANLPNIVLPPSPPPESESEDDLDDTEVFSGSMPDDLVELADPEVPPPIAKVGDGYDAPTSSG